MIGKSKGKQISHDLAGWFLPTCKARCGDRLNGDRERRDKPAHCRGWESPTEKEKRLHSGLESCL